MAADGPEKSLVSLVCLAIAMVSAGCEIGPAMFLNGRDSDIKNATKAIEAARDDGQRAKAYSSRGAAYSEKARYSRIMKLIPNDEYVRLFDLSIKDHNQAVALNPASADVYFNRAQANYDRGALDLLENKTGKSWFDAAASDFEQAAQKDPNNSLVFDRLGLTYESNGQADNAIRAYTKEMALDPLGKIRLADAYCNIGFRHQQQKEFAAAALAYQKSVEFGTADDKTCPSEPFESMVAIYTSATREYDKAWEAVRQAQRTGRLISPELIERLKKESGRTN